MASLEEVGVHLVARDDLTRKLERVQLETKKTARDLRTLGGAEVTRGLSQTTTGLGDLTRNAGNLTGALSGVHGGLTRLSSSLGGATLAGARTLGLGLGALTGAALGFGLKAASGFEQSQLALGTLLGDVTAGKELFGDLQAFNLKTPFGLAGLTDATQQLVLYGFAGQEALGIIKRVSDVAASSGPRAQENLGRITYALGQIKSAGVIRAEELNQLTEAGFPAIQALKELTGQTGPELRKALQEGLDPEIATRFLDAVGSGQLKALARFRGGAEAQSRTLSGVLSNFKDGILVSLATSTQPLADSLIGDLPALQASVAGLITTAVPGLTRLVGAIADQAPAAIEAFTPVLGQLTEGLADLAGEVGPHMPEIIGLLTELAGVVPELVGVAIDLVPVLASVVGVFSDFLALPFGDEAALGLLGVLLGYRALTGVAGAVTAFAAALDVLTGAQQRNNATTGPTGPKGGGKFGNLAKFAAGASGLALTVDGATGASTLGNDLETVGGATLTGATIGSVVPGIGTGVGAAVGAVAGLGIVGGKRLGNFLDNSNRVPAGGLRAGGGTTVNSSTNVGGIVVNNPTSNVDVAQAVQDGIRQARLDEERRSGS